MNNRGKNTNNSLPELLAIMQDINKGNFDFDGMHPGTVIREIKEDIEFLTNYSFI